MDNGGGLDWRRWALVAVVAGVVAALVATAVAGLRVAQPAPAGVGVQGVASRGTHFTGPVAVEGGISTGGNITMTSNSASIVNSGGDSVNFGDGVTVSGLASLASLGVSSYAQLNNGLYVADNVTMSTGSLLNSRGAVTVTDVLNVTGGVLSGNNITVTGGLTATGWLRGYGVALQPATTLAITTNYGITPGNYSLILLTDDGGQASGTVTLDNSVSIVDGTYVGQLCLIVYVDTAGATMTVQDNANTLLSGDLALGLGDSLLVVWNGTDWVQLGTSDN